MTSCKTCELVARRNQGNAPLWDCIYQTAFWDVAHCYDSALLGWLVLVARRHIASLAELTNQEAVELGQLIRNTSFALKEVTGCVKTYALQFAESQEHQHVHFHIIPRMPELPEDYRSTQIFKYLGVPEKERVSQNAMNAIAVRIRKILLERPI
jgi:diadenosine tetraphosphate (Ap4A) HIT family hydrolase